MRRRDPNTVPSDLRDHTCQMNIQRARASELLELMKELPGTDVRLERLMDTHHSALMSFLRLSEALSIELDRRFDDDE